MKTFKYNIQDMYSLKLSAYINTFRAESTAFKLMCAYLLLEYVRPQSIYPQLDVAPWSLITLILAATFYLVQPEKNKQKEIYFTTPLFFAFTIHALLSGWLAYSQDEAFKNIDIILSWLIVYFLIISIVNTERRFLIFLMLFFLFNLKMSQHGFKTWVGRGFSFSSWGVAGAPGYFANSGEFGIQMCIFFPLVTATALGLKDYLTKFKYRVLLFISVTAVGSVIATSSRGALVGLVIIVALYLIRGDQIFKKLLIGGVILAAIYFIVPEEFKARFETAGSDTTSITRLEYWKNGKEIADNNPIFGIGYMNWNVYYYEHYFDPTIYRKVETAHNTFIQAMAELGYTGLGLLLLMIYASIKVNLATKAIGIKSGNSLYVYLPVSLNLALVGMLVTTFFIAALYYPFYWIHFALTVSLNKAAKDNANFVSSQKLDTDPGTGVIPDSA